MVETYVVIEFYAAHEILECNVTFDFAKASDGQTQNI